MNFSSDITKNHKIKLLGLVMMGLLVFILTWPFAFGYQHLEQSYGLVFMLAGIIPYLIGFLIVIPWIALSWAAAYDNLSREYQEKIYVEG